jgi:hypothetical protein
MATAKSTSKKAPKLKEPEITVEDMSKELTPGSAKILFDKAKLVKQVMEVGTVYCQGGEYAPLTWDKLGTKVVESPAVGDASGEYITVRSLYRWPEALKLVQRGDECDDEDWADFVKETR